MFIYKITNKINGKSYIGQTKQPIFDRWKQHLKNSKQKINRYLYDAINHYGINNFLIEEIEKCSPDKINDREIFNIFKYNTLMPNGYNMTTGGGGGDTLSNHPEKIEIFKNIVKKTKGQKRTKRQRKNISIGSITREKNKTQEEKKRIAKRISETKKRLGQKPPEQYINKEGCVGFFKGKKHTKETKRKLKNVRLGKKYEDFLSNELSNKLKKEKKIRWLSDKNPNYILFSDEQKQKLLSLLIKNNNISLLNCGEIIKISLYKIRTFLQKKGIQNYQHFRKLKIEEQIKKLEEIKNEIKD